MLGKKISYLRKERKLSQRELAKELNIGNSTLAMYELEKREPDFNTLQKIADYFDVSTDYLLGRTDIKKSELDNEEEEKDIEKVIDELLEQDGLMLCGEAVDEEALILLRNSIRTTLEIMRGKK
ncbi:helix-turn-helix transcriptional regulator [Clostridioides mangenotii]|uniref:helix-turn-helix domain-containing protein n=1 Tax=Metaclostridioides mangenotii TaxID=1540 RepID=UPI00214A553E|nr:helix-turn-helix transcriptional regulator [Clostridioides mangenotii]MCR1953326.1 helix-turn-helix transcriptional regulator [Clostridioides mangenotii]